jgi:hypothetical protein
MWVWMYCRLGFVYCDNICTAQLRPIYHRPALPQSYECVSTLTLQQMSCPQRRFPGWFTIPPLSPPREAVPGPWQPVQMPTSTDCLEQPSSPPSMHTARLLHAEAQAAKLRRKRIRERHVELQRLRRRLVLEKYMRIADKAVAFIPD